jgi:hypothetical protein
MLTEKPDLRNFSVNQGTGNSYSSVEYKNIVTTSSSASESLIDLSLIPASDLRNLEDSDRPGYTKAELAKFSRYVDDLTLEGFKVPRNSSGRVFEADLSQAKLARLTVPIANSVGNGYIRYLQSEGEGKRFFKTFVANPSSTEITVVEGVFDALAVCKSGRNALAYSGILNAFDGSNLHEDFSKLLKNYSTVVVGYDIDNTHEKRLYAEKQILRLTNLLEKQEKTVFLVNSWNRNLGKDLDEILVKQGIETLDQILNSRSSYKHWSGFAVSNSYTPTHTEHSKYLSDLVLKLIDDHKVVFINAPMGAGKTHSLITLLKDKYPSAGCLIVSPLIVLGKQICKDLRDNGIDITYREDMEARKNWERIVSCLESIKPNGKLRIQLDGSQMMDKILVIDELSQVVSTLLSGSTISKERVTIIQCLTALLRQAKKRIFLGADITDFDCQVIEKLLGDSVEKWEICKYLNTRKRNTFNATIVDVSEAISIAHILASAGARVMLAVDSQKSTSTYSGINLKELFSQYSEDFGLPNVPKENILSIDSVTTKTIGHEAYEIVHKGKKELLHNKNLVICSPSVDKGWSLDADKNYFDILITLHMGQSDPDSVCQFTMRDRNTEIPRIIAFGGRARLSFGGGLTPKQIQSEVYDAVKRIETATNAKKNKEIIDRYELNSYLDLSLGLDLGDLKLDPDFFTEQAIKNLKMSMRSHYVKTKLMAQGVTFFNSPKDILPIDLLEILQGTDEAVKASRSPKLKDIAHETTHREALREFKAPNYDDKKVESLKDVSALTQEQIDACNKYFVRKTLKFEDICIEDIEDGKWNKFKPEALYYYLTEGRSYVEFLETTRIAALHGIPLHNPTSLIKAEDNPLEKLYSQDILTGALAHKIGLLEKLKVKEAIEYAQTKGISNLFLINCEELTEVPEIILECLQLVKDNKKEIIATFDWTNKDFKAENTTLFSKVLELVGFKYAPSKRIRVKIDGVVKQKTTCFEITSDRKFELKRKRFDALTNDLNEKQNNFITNQLLVKAGRQLIARSKGEGSFSDLLKKYKQETLLEAARRLPRQSKDDIGYGLSEHSKLLMHLNGHTPKLEAEISIVNTETIEQFEITLRQWIDQKTEIGFDTETYESITHKDHCTVNKNGKWQWLNPQTGKHQTIKPGLDQNHNLVRLLQFTDGDRTFVIDLGKCDAPALPVWFGKAWVLIQDLCKQNTIVGHNLKFDTSSIRKYDLSIRKPYCTMLTTKLLFGDCGAGKVLSGGYALKSVTHNLLGLEVDKTEQASNWGNPELTHNQIVYAATDAVLTLALKEILELMLENPTAWNLAEMQAKDSKHANLDLIRLENANIYQTTEMQWLGVPVNTKVVQKTIAKLETLIKKVEDEWYALKMPCKPSQALKVVEELNRRYYEHQYPFTERQLIEFLGVELVDIEGLAIDLDSLATEDLQLPTLDKPITKSNKDTINDHSDLPELNLLKAWRSYKTTITQLSKVLLSAEINNGRCKSEYQPLSGTGRMSCGNDVGLGTPNLQAFSKKAEGRFYGFSDNQTNKRTLNNWWLPSVEETIKVRKLFELTQADYAFITEDANASHARLAVGFGKCEFGKQSQIGGIDSHSMFAILALQAILTEQPDALDTFPEIKDFVQPLTEEQIKLPETTKAFKNLDEKITGARFRSAAKTLFYSVLNGAQADKMRKVLSSALGKPVNINAGEIMFSKFWSLYTGVKAYIDKVLDYAANHAINFGGIEFNITELPDGVKLMYSRKEGDLAVTNLIACQWSRCEATALKKIMQSVEKLPSEMNAQIINMVHDEIGVICRAEYWQDVYRHLSDTFALEYGVYLDGFIPCDESTEVKLAKKLEADISYIPKSWADK